MKIKELCTDDRPREKLLLRGAAALSDSELLAIMLRTGTGDHNVVELASRLLMSADGRLNGIASMSVDRLCTLKGIGPDKAATLVAVFELGRRTASESIVQNKMPVTSPAQVFSMMLPLLRGLGHEECWAIYLNRANYVLGKEKVSSGSADSTVLDVKGILRRALEKKAEGVIVVHNHPSGSPLPGHADIAQTRMLKSALQTCQIQLVDHVIVAEDSCYSFADERIVNEKFCDGKK